MSVKNLKLDQANIKNQTKPYLIMEPYAKIDQTKFPIVTIDFMPFDPTKAQFQAYLDEMDTMYLKDGRRAIIFDASKTKYLPSELRIMQGTWLKLRKEQIKDKVVIMVFIIPNVMVQMVFKGILLVEPLPAPYKLAKSMEEAMEIAKEPGQTHLELLVTKKCKYY